ncbi:MAG: type III-B CRISPR module-associated protein Cmr3 [Anaerolineae bacterium]
MTVWLIEPRDPVIFRDGRPFNASPGARAKTLAFPLPATMAGATRTRAGLDANGRFDKRYIAELKQKQVRGPLLVEVKPDASGEEITWLVPAPADALLLKQEPHDKTRAHIVPLTVVEDPAGVATNLPAQLALVAPVQHANQKPHSAAPAFWRWQAYQDWLASPKVHEGALLADWGLAGPVRESRMHVSVKSATQTAQDGALFQTSGLEFVSLAPAKDASPPVLAQAKGLALVLETDAELEPGLGFLGGERRLASWRLSPASFPGCPDAVRKAIVDQKHCRLILATPAIFAGGFLPDVSKLSRAGVAVTVQAVVNGRYQVVSGWDYESDRPKPTRRLASAGSVYFLKLEGGKDAINQFIDVVWLQAISDDEQDCRDGFGLALLGAWDGEPKPFNYGLEVSK